MFSEGTPPMLAVFQRGLVPFNGIKPCRADRIAPLRDSKLVIDVERIAKEQVPRARSRAIEALNDTEEAVMQNPLAVVAIALGLGLLIGELTRR
jgi:DUF883 C-terminal glycine zipper region